jgi:DNA-binding NtrC family response regulator
MKGRNVLVVEDCNLMAAALQDMLVEAGAGLVCLASSVAASLAAMDRYSIDIACLDINLGSETSFRLADELAARGIPFVFVSAYQADVVPPPHRHRPFVDKLQAWLELVPACRAARLPHSRVGR